MKKSFFLVIVALTLMWCTPAGAENGKVVIKRDHYGVSHVYADTVYGVFYGYGYAIARDRLFQMDMVRYTGQGRVAEIMGGKFVDFDKKIRSNYNPLAIKAQLAALPKNEHDIFQGYADGINAWLEQIDTNPNLLPTQYEDFGFMPKKWSAFDVAMVFVGTMLNRFGDFNTELLNLNILLTLKEQHGEKNAMKIFNQLIPKVVKGAPTTIPAEDWPIQTTFDESSQNSLHAALSSENLDSSSHHRRGAPFSNIMIIGKEKAKGADSILMNGPQFGWYIPSYVYSIGLHGAGFNVVGNTPYGYPIVLFGHNPDITWGSTWGAGDIIDVYRVQLDPNDPHAYMHNGSKKQMLKRTELIKVKGEEPVSHDVFWTHYGPVLQIDTEENIAFTKKRSWDGRELDTLIGWLNTTKASNWEEFTQEAARSALNVNMYYADSKGNIGYAFTGKYPIRKAGHDNRLPVAGDGTMDWGGFQPFEDNPQVLNPKQGYIVNWNNRPAYGKVLNPDMFWYSWSKADRVKFFIDYAEAKERLSPVGVWGVIEPSSCVDVNARYFVPFIKEAGQKTSDEFIKKAAQIVAHWDLMSRDRNSDGYYDEPATAIFRAFLTAMLKETLADDLGKAFPFFASDGYATPEKPMSSSMNLQVGTKTVVESLLASQEYDFFNGQEPVDVVLAALSTAVDQLKKEQEENIEAWRIPAAPMAFINENFLKIPQALEGEAFNLTPAMNRGTENNLTVFKDGQPTAWEVTPPGQSGFVAKDGTPDRHYKDQVEMYEVYGRKRTYLFEGDVQKNMSDKVVLNY